MEAHPVPRRTPDLQGDGRLPDVGKHDLRSINECVSGAMKLPVEVAAAFEQITGGRLVEGYGLTETSPVTHANPLTGPRRSGMIGIPIPARWLGSSTRRIRRSRCRSGSRASW